MVSGINNLSASTLNWKRTLTDPSFWILLIANCYLVYKYEQNPDIFSTLIWLYWSQSVLYGLFAFVNILTTKTPASIDETTGDNGLPNGKRSLKDATAFFFLAHYGFFHLVYCIFLSTMTKLSLFDWQFFKYYLGIFFLSLAVNFISHKIQKRTLGDDLGKMMLLPYLRIIPMHLCILIPAFLSVTRLTVFLVMKVVADVFMYALTNTYYKRVPLAELTALNMNSNIASE